MYGSIELNGRNAVARENGCAWGLVKIQIMKNPIPLSNLKDSSMTKKSEIHKKESN